MDRAAFVSGASSALALLGLPERAPSFAALEARYGGRLGVAAFAPATSARLAHRASERFAMCSTFKLLLAGNVLARVDAGKERLDRRIGYGTADLLEYAPVTRANVRHGFMSVREMCEAAVEYSDNGAANLLLRSVGGPSGLTAFARSLGDTVTRLDRTEPALNTAIPGDVRDTTSPDAMLATMQKLVTGSALRPRSRAKLAAWLLKCRTGTERIRAGLPPGWREGDKTGSGERASSNDVAILYPPRRAPVFVAAYYTGSSASSDERNRVLAEVGRIVSSTLV